MRIILGLACLILSSPAVASPPPPPPFVDNIARQLLAPLTPENEDRDAALFADDLQVTLDGRIIAHNNAEWLARQGALAGTVDRFVYGYVEGRNSILLIERVDDRSDEHCRSGNTCVFDPRWLTRAEKYELGPDHLVHAIRMVETDGILQTPSSRR